MNFLMDLTLAKNLCKINIIKTYLPYLIFGILSIILGINVENLFGDSSKYIKTSGEIINGVAFHDISSSRRSNVSSTGNPKFKFNISYTLQYIVNDKVYSKTFRDPSTYPNKVLADMAISGRIGTTMDVYYNPDNPSSSVDTLNVENYIMYFLIIFGGILIYTSVYNYYLIPKYCV